MSVSNNSSFNFDNIIKITFSLNFKPKVQSDVSEYITVDKLNVVVLL